MHLRIRLFALAAIALLAIPALADTPPVFLLKFGSPGRNPGQFAACRGIACDATGNVYVADIDRNVVEKFTGQGQFIFEFGGPGSGHGTFQGALDVAVDGAGVIFVSDASNGLIEVFSPSGTFLRQWSEPAARYITLDPTGALLATYAYGESVFVERTSDGASVSRFKFRDYNAVEHGSIGIGPNGILYIASEGDYWVKRFSLDGTFLGQWGGFGSGPGLFSGTIGLTAAPDGSVYVVDGKATVQRFDAAGTFLSEFGGGPGSADGQFRGFSDIAADAVGSIFIADPSLARIQKFGDPATTTRRGSWGGLKMLFRK